MDWVLLHDNGASNIKNSLSYINLNISTQRVNVKRKMAKLPVKQKLLDKYEKSLIL